MDDEAMIEQSLAWHKAVLRDHVQVLLRSGDFVLYAGVADPDEPAALCLRSSANAVSLYAQRAHAPPFTFLCRQRDRRRLGRI